MVLSTTETIFVRLSVNKRKRAELSATERIHYIFCAKLRSVRFAADIVSPIVLPDYFIREVATLSAQSQVRSDGPYIPPQHPRRSLRGAGDDLDTSCVLGPNTPILLLQYQVRPPPLQQPLSISLLTR